MHFNLIQWLFTDPFTAATNGGLSVSEEPFHFYVSWIIFCSLGVLVAFYYSVEGRKRFVKDKPIIKYMLDRYLGWSARLGHHLGRLPHTQISKGACQLPGLPEPPAIRPQEQQTQSNLLQVISISFMLCRLRRHNMKEIGLREDTSRSGRGSALHPVRY